MEDEGAWLAAEQCMKLLEGASDDHRNFRAWSNQII